MPFSGVAVALVTLFDDAGALLAKETAEHAARLAARGVTAIVVAGTTGEAATLDEDERDDLVRAVRAAVPAGVPVVAGTGAPSSRQAARLTRRAADAGADAVLVLSPPGQPDPRPYYGAVAAAAADLPLLAYHYPAVSPPGIPAAVLADLPAVGLKDSTGSPDRLLEELEAGARVWVGSSAVLALAGPLGAEGAILALANLAPEDCAAALAGDAAAQRRLAGAHLAVRDGGVARLKALLAAASTIPTTVRAGR